MLEGDTLSVLTPSLCWEWGSPIFPGYRIWGLCCLVLSYNLDFVIPEDEWLRQLCALELCFLPNFQHLGVSQVMKHPFYQLMTLPAVSCLCVVAWQADRVTR